METKGYSSYVEKFGSKFSALEELPYQINPKSRMDPTFLPEDEIFGELCARCVKRGSEFTTREAVDALYLHNDGKYRFGNVEKSAYGDFINAVSKIDIDY